MLFPLLFLLLLSHKNASDLFGRAAVQSGTWPLGIYKNQTITLRNFNTDGSADNEGVGKILFEASLTSLTKGDLILGSTNHASTSDGRHTVGKKILELQARQDAIMAELLGLTPPSPPPPSPPPPPPDYSYLGEGECRQSDGSYPIKFSKGYYDLNPHTSGTNAEQALDRCKAKCFAFAWCLAAEVVLRDIWDTPECRLITDWNAYVVESTNTFQNNQWGGTQSIDGENYQTYCNGGSSPCSSSNVFDGGKLNSRDGYHCYIKA